MADPGPRQRSASTVADDAAQLVADAQRVAGQVGRYGSRPATRGDVRRVADLVERLGAQLEDLAAVVASPLPELIDKLRLQVPDGTDPEDDGDGLWSGYLAALLELDPRT